MRLTVWFQYAIVLSLNTVGQLMPYYKQCSGKTYLYFKQMKEQILVTINVKQSISTKNKHYIFYITLSLTSGVLQLTSQHTY